jgi:hypothetical protein
MKIFTFSLIFLLLTTDLFSQTEGENFFGKSVTSRTICPICWGGGKQGLGAYKGEHKLCQGRGCIKCNWEGKVWTGVASKCMGCGGTGKFADFLRVFKISLEKDKNTIRRLPTDCEIKDSEGNLVKGKSSVYYITDKHRIYSENKKIIGTFTTDYKWEKTGIPNAFYTGYIGKDDGNWIGFALESSSAVMTNASNSGKILSITSENNECYCVGLAILAEGPVVKKSYQIEPEKNSTPSISSKTSSENILTQKESTNISEESRDKKIKDILNRVSDKNIYPINGLVMSLDGVDSFSFQPMKGKWLDISGNNNDGNIYLNPFVKRSGLDNPYLNLDGVNDCVTFNNSPSLNPTTGITLLSWFRMDNFVSNQNIISKGYNSVTLPYVQYSLKMDDKPPFNIPQFNLSLNDKLVSLNASTELSKGKWYLVVCTYDKNTMKIIINNVADSNMISETNNISYYSSPLNLGKWPTGNSQYFDGQIGMVLIYNRALSISEVDNIWNKTKSQYGY